MGRAPRCDKSKVKRGPWSPEEDTTLRNYVHKHGIAGSCIALPHKAGLKRCGKSCRLRWLNYLRPNIKHGGFTEEEDTVILTLYHSIGSRWSVIASQLPGRTDNDIKNYWNTKLKKRFFAATNAAGIVGSRNSELDSMASYFAVGHDRFNSYQEILNPQIQLSTLIEAPENLENANDYSSSSLSPPINASGSSACTNGGYEEDEALVVEYGCGGMPYHILNAFGSHENFNHQITNIGFGFQSSNYQSSRY